MVSRFVRAAQAATHLGSRGVGGGMYECTPLAHGLPMGPPAGHKYLALLSLSMVYMLYSLQCCIVCITISRHYQVQQLDQSTCRS